MKLFTLFYNLSAKTPSMTSPAQFVFVSVPLTIIVLAILVVAFQINRQLYDQQQVIVGRLAHAAVRHTAQLQREHLRLFAMIEATRETLDEAPLELQRNLVESRLRIMQTTLQTSEMDQEMYALYDNYAERWYALEPQIILWQGDPNNVVRKEQIIMTLEEIELNLNQISTLAQLSFEDRMKSWGNKSRFLNQLLTLGSISFAIIVALMAYTSYLFVHSQATNERILRKSEQRLRVILEAIPDAVYRVNSAGIYTDYKPATDKTHCLSQAAFSGQSLTTVLPDAAASQIQEGIQSVLASGKKLLLELTVPDPTSNELYHLEARLLPSGSDEMQIVVRDITTVRQQEKAALQAQKLESLGVLAGGIAHDFNNLLAGMLGQASLAATKLERGLPAQGNIQKVILSAERAADLTRQLLAYTGKGKFQIGPLDMNQLLNDTISLMGTTLPSNANLVLALQDDLPLVQADRTQIQQVFMNLFINAIEALPDEEGCITITTGVSNIDDDTCNRAPFPSAQVIGDALEPGTYVAIQITDTGVGMDQATLSRIFDPFFSTKPKGHGLGLSATIGIIRTHHGSLQVQSQLGVGTTFHILLPALANAPAVEPEESNLTPLDFVKVQKTVLVIDDEADVRETATDILITQGYDVIAAANGDEGITLFRANHCHIGLVLLDLKMPGRNGPETYQELRKIQPDLKVIFTSGYSEAEVATLTQNSPRLTFLPKPYTVESLSQQSCQLLALGPGDESDRYQRQIAKNGRVVAK